MTRFTDKFISALKPQLTPYDVREVDGFMVRVQPTGTKTFYYTYKTHGKIKRVRLGKYPGLSLSKARSKHRDLLDKRDAGEPIEPTRDAMTVKDLIDFYLREWAKPNKRSWKEDERILTKDIEPRWGHLPADKITRADVIALLEKIHKRGGRLSNLTLAIIRKMFNFGVERGRLEHSPCHMVKPLAMNVKKDRYLDAAEIKTLWMGLKGAETIDPISRGLLLILATAQRPGEVLGMTWEEIEGRWWTIPAARTKNKRPHRCYLNDMGLALIGEHPKNDAGDEVTGLVLPSPITGREISVQALSKNLRRDRLRPKKERRLDIEHFTPHDLRRTAATLLAESGHQEFLIGKLLNHTNQAVTGIYNRYQYDKELQELAQSLGKRLEEITRT